MSRLSLTCTPAVPACSGSCWGRRGGGDSLRAGVTLLPHCPGAGRAALPAQELPHHPRRHQTREHPALWRQQKAPKASQGYTRLQPGNRSEAKGSRWAPQGFFNKKMDLGVYWQERNERQQVPQERFTSPATASTKHYSQYKTLQPVYPAERPLLSLLNTSTSLGSRQLQKCGPAGGFVWRMTTGHRYLLTVPLQPWISFSGL